MKEQDMITGRNILLASHRYILFLITGRYFVFWLFKSVYFLMRITYETLEYDPASKSLDEFLESIRARLINGRRVIIRIYYVLDEEQDNRKFMRLLGEENNDPALNYRMMYRRLMN